MKIKNLNIGNIPAIIWGEASDKIIIATHGNMSHKADTAIRILSEEALKKGYQVLSYDLPEHGERKNDPARCKIQHCVKELKKVIKYAQSISGEVSIFGCSIGAYFSLLATKGLHLQQALFLSPVVDMKEIIENMMGWFNISEDCLKEKKEIPTPTGQTLFWDAYCYVRENPIKNWCIPTSVLYGSKDEICSFNSISSFSKQFNCSLDILDKGEHFFHTNDQLTYYRNWLKKELVP